MSRLQRLRAGMSRMGARMAEYRAQAERERDERKRERRIRAEQETAEAAPPPPQDLPSPSERPEPAAVIPWGMRVAAEAGWRLLVLAGVIWVLMQVLAAISLLIIAVSAGLLITALLQPTVSRLKRLGLGRGPATTLTFVGGFAGIGLVGWFVVWQVIENVDDLVEQVQNGIDDLRQWILASPFKVTEDQLNEYAENLSRWVGEHSQELTSAGLEGAQYVVTFFTGAALAAFVTLFLLYDGRRIWQWVLKFVPFSAREGVAGAGPRAWVTLTGYVRGTVIVALIDAIGIGVGIYILGVPMAVPLAVIVFLFAFIPIVGAVISGALAVLVAFVTKGLATALLALAVVLIVQQIESHVLQPFILGRLVRVHPLAVVLAVTGGTLLAGIPGAVVAVPVVAVANTVVTYLRAYAEQQHPTVGVLHGSTASEVSPAVPALLQGEKLPTGGTAESDCGEETPRPPDGPGGPGGPGGSGSAGSPGAGQ
ncbi:AI-2E family transporter [Streptomyces gobiensis]|uniref:AI-2E family transporter n=1 Tax=Streptomyces gobiensis TaxID=2875706 RepID=UPI001E48BB41|nr:AI-2E family transporter [Streptomyces gobiensis]UGY93417.1 AI-2E family transporter [Streptomyces gobiensis]